jgi:hypothetical protein
MQAAQRLREEVAALQGFQGQLEDLGLALELLEMEAAEVGGRWVTGMLAGRLLSVARCRLARLGSESTRRPPICRRKAGPAAWGRARLTCRSTAMTGLCTTTSATVH